MRSSSATTGAAFRIAALGMKRVRIRSGMDFADARADARRGLDLARLGVDEHAGDDSRVGEPGDGFGSFAS